MLCSWKRLRHRILHVQIRVNLAYFHISFVNELSDFVITAFNVFGLLVGPWFLSLRHGSTIVAIDIHGVFSARDHTKLSDELLNPISLLRSFRSCDVLRLRCRIHDRILLRTFPGHGTPLSVKTYPD